MFLTESPVTGPGASYRGGGPLRVIFMLACLLRGLGCAGGPEFSTKVVCGSGYYIATSAKIGCRNPEDLGCATCCRSAGNGCTQLSWESAGTSGVSPWYNSTQSTATCPQRCPPCASCLARDEGLLCSLLATQRSCDCANLTIGPNPCTADGCECYCFNYMSLTAACPAR